MGTRKMEMVEVWRQNLRDGIILGEKFTTNRRVDLIYMLNF